MADRLENREICRGAWFARMDDGPGAIAPYLEGLRLPPKTVENLKGSPDTFSFNGGSGNWPWVAAAATDDLEFMDASLKVERERGLGRCEIGAEVYPERLPAKMWGLRRVREGAPAPAGFADLMRSNLAAEIAAVALVCVPTHVASLTQRIFHEQAGAGESEMAGNGRYYKGWSSALPSQRSNFAVFLDGLLAPLAAWACGEPELSLRRRFVDHWWPIAAAEKVVGAPFAAPTPPEIWGLTAEQRDACRAWVHGDTVALPTVLAMTDGWFPMAQLTLYRTSQGAAGWMGGVGEAEGGSSLHTFKPAILFRRADRDGRAALAMPARFNKAGQAARGISYFDPADGTVLTEADGVSYRNPLPGDEVELWLSWGPPGHREVKTGEASEPPEPETPARPAAALAADLRRLAQELAPPGGGAPARPRAALADDLEALAREVRGA